MVEVVVMVNVTSSCVIRPARPEARGRIIPHRAKITKMTIAFEFKLNHLGLVRTLIALISPSL